MRNPQLTSIVPCRRAPVPGAMEAAFAEFLRVDVASGDASLDTVEHYFNEVEYWVAWCSEQGFDPATVTTAHIKRYRQALIEAKYNPITIRWKLSIVRRFYEAARNAGLRLDNPAAGVCVTPPKISSTSPRRSCPNCCPRFPIPRLRPDGTSCAACAISSWSG
jgi:site-specific recombinase XerD